MVRAWLLVVVVAACSGRRPARELPTARPVATPSPWTAALPDPVPGELVLLRDGAWIASDVGPSAARARLSEGDDPRRAWLFRVIAADAGVVVVENLVSDDGDGHCHPDVPARLEDLRLRLFVQRADVLPVVRRNLRVDYPDKTSLELAAGTPLRGRLIKIAGTPGQLGAEVIRGDLTLPVVIPAADVGGSYPAPGRLTSGDRGVAASVHEGAMLRYGGEHTLRARLTKPLAIRRVGAHGGDVKVAGGDQCVWIRAWVPATQLGKPLGLLTSSGGGWGEGCSHADSVGAGATVLWPDGREAGVVRKDITLCHDRTGGGELRCFDWRILREHQEGKLPICFRPKDLR